MCQFCKLITLESDTFLDLYKPIGKGQSGTVYLGEVYKTELNGHFGSVAFKCSDSSSSILDIKNFLSEIKILSYIGHHENIICFIGAYTEKLDRGYMFVNSLQILKLHQLHKSYIFANYFRYCPPSTGILSIGKFRQISAGKWKTQVI